MSARDTINARFARALRVIRNASMLDNLRLRALPAATAMTLKQGMSARSMVALHALAHPERPMLVDARRTWSYAEADADINRLANALRRELTMAPGSRGMVAAENRGEYLIAWQALMRLGCSMMHGSYRATAAELAHLLSDGRPSVLFAGARTGQAVRQALEELPGEPPLLVALDPEAGGDGALGWSELLERGSAGFPDTPRRQRGSDSVVYTSGTTGRPKGAVRDTETLGPTEFFRVMERLPFRAGDKHLVVAPLYHSAAQVFANIHLSLAGTLEIHAHFDAEQTLRALSEGGAHSVFLVPTMLRRVLDLDPELLSSLPAPELRAIVSGAAPFPHALRLRAAECFGAEKLFDFYGSTEIGWVTTVRGDEMLERPGTIGRPLPGQDVRILDEERRELPCGQQGMIYVSNEQLMSGYLNRPEATSETTHGARMTCEDLGRLDEDGYLYLSGRRRDMVISGGVNLYPAEIEEILAHHPAVVEVAVVGVPDEEWGERLAAFVVLAEPVADADLAAHAASLLSSQKIPRSWHRVDELPRNPTGKVLKHELAERLRT